MISLEVQGKNYIQFISASVELRLDSLCNQFKFSLTAQGDTLLPFKGGELCKVRVNNFLVITGYIEVVTISASSRSHIIEISGRDKTGDLVDSTLEPISDLTAPITLKQVVEKVLSSLNLDLKVVDEVSPKPFNKAEDIIAPEPAENAFSFLEKMARKRNVLLSSNSEGDITITKADAVRVPKKIRNIINSNSNNVISCSAQYDTTGRYNVYKIVSSLNISALNFSGSTSNSDIVNQAGKEIDDSIRAGRTLALTAETSSSNAQNKERATWEANIRKARGLVYSCVLQGFSNGEGIWSVKQLASVVDNLADVNSEMLVNAVVFNSDVSQGSTTELQFVNQKAYSLSLSEPKTGGVGVNIFG